ncbi:MAG: orotidine 5'-phosphate decarboxylase / HUMPS family protein [Sulfolobales archaeon]
MLGRSGSPKIQIALDLIDRNLLIEMALYAYRRGVDIIEIGTPAIKRFGTGIIGEIRRAIGDDGFILADMKIADTSRLEIGLAADEGADAVTIMGVAYDEVISEAAKSGRDYNVEVWCDLIYVERYVERALRVKELGLDTVILHVGVDIQRKRGVTAEILGSEVEKISREGLRVAVAGGLDPVKARGLISRGASIVIIGGWITQSVNWRERIDEAVKIIKG